MHLVKVGGRARQHPKYWTLYQTSILKKLKYKILIAFLQSFQNVTPRAVESQSFATNTYMI